MYFFNFSIIYIIQNNVLTSLIIHYQADIEHRELKEKAFIFCEVRRFYELPRKLL